jgi:hypothetical protein
MKKQNQVILSKIADRVGNKYLFQVPREFSNLADDVLTNGTLVAIRIGNGPYKDLTGLFNDTHWRCGNPILELMLNVDQAIIGSYILEHLKKVGAILPREWVEKMEINPRLAAGIIFDLPAAVNITEPIVLVRDEQAMLKDLLNKIKAENLSFIDSGYVFKKYKVYRDVPGYFIKDTLKCRNCSSDIPGTRRITRMQGKFIKAHRFLPDDHTTIKIKSKYNAFLCNCSRKITPEIEVGKTLQRPIEKFVDPPVDLKFTKIEICKIIKDSVEYKDLIKHIDLSLDPDSPRGKEYMTGTYNTFRKFQKVLEVLELLN